ncbi:SPX domain-containing protein 4-like [Nymphaea colorata]|nr:SPX domain-containing protein 4-like [Nymphaea colorata]
MKFGKEFGTHLEQTLPDWRDKFLCYKPLKKLLKQIAVADPAGSAGFYDGFNVNGSASPVPRSAWNGVEPGHMLDGLGGDGIRVSTLEEWFVGLLDRELEKFNDFYVDKEEEFIIRLQELKERIEWLKQKTHDNGDLTSENEFSEEMIVIRNDYVAIHGEMVLLENYSSLNFIGLLKILKKYDKRTGALLRLPFTQRALRQPFFTTEPLTRLVHECEDNLQLLFPLEAEIVEPQTHAEQTDNSNPTEAAVTLHGNTIEIYRSTLAAIRTIQGLRRESSTYNPLSFASVFHDQDDNESRATTAENSVSGSSTVLQNEEKDQAASFPVSKAD